MYYNRIQLKIKAKRRLKQKTEFPPILTVTLLFLMLTSLLDDILSIFYSVATDNMMVELNDLLVDSTVIDYEAIRAVLLSYLNSTAGMVSLFFSIFMTLYVIVMSVGYCWYIMKIARNQTDAGYSDLSIGLELLPKVVILAILQFVFISLWSMLFFFPGLIAMYRYRMCYYVLLDDPEISPMEALRRSKKLMQGHKMDLLVLDLSFLGWSFLIVFIGTMGSELGYGIIYLTTGLETPAEFASVILGFALYCIAGLWLTAYIQLADVYFYHFVCNCAQGFDMNAPQDYYENGDAGENNQAPPRIENPSDWKNDPWN